jgi:DNA-binding transcriptional MerR regulator
MRVPIGEFSMMTRLSRKALRHYHDLGLLEPAYVDPATGYRFYDTGQVATAQMIRRFRQLDMPVPEVKAVLATPDLAARNEIIAAHLRRMEAQLEQTRETVGVLRELLEGGRPITVELRSVPPIRAWAITATVDLDEVGEWWTAARAELRSALATAGAEAIGPLGGRYDPELFADERGQATLFVPTAAPGPPGRIRAITIPAGDFAVATHHGPHTGMVHTYATLGGYVTERAIGAPGPVQENYLYDAPDVTELCWPIR